MALIQSNENITLIYQHYTFIFIIGNRMYSFNYWDSQPKNKGKGISTNRNLLLPFLSGSFTIILYLFNFYLIDSSIKERLTEIPLLILNSIGVIDSEEVLRRNIEKVPRKWNETTLNLPRYLWV